ncbi:MAG: DNA-binding protein WhiA [Eubacteriales bacterium]|nr:DNA-binding protein WhiA [Eubacteriales bacterium]
MSYSSELKEYLKQKETENKKECCRKAHRAGLELEKAEFVCEKDRGCYLRGVFIACGSMTDPDKQYYVSFSGSGAEIAAEALISCGITPLFGTRKGRSIVYLRESDAISDFLAAVGASKNALGLLEIGVINSMKREANRKNNADLANLDRTATASAEVRSAISEIISHKDYRKLPEELKETAKLRLENPSLTLEELRLIHAKPISKSGLYHRLKKLTELSLKYK